MSNGTTIRDHNIRPVIVGTKSTHSLEATDFKVGTPKASLNSTRVAVVDPLKQHFKFSIGSAQL